MLATKTCGGRKRRTTRRTTRKSLKRKGGVKNSKKVKKYTKSKKTRKTKKSKYLRKRGGMMSNESQTELGSSELHSTEATEVDNM